MVYLWCFLLYCGGLELCRLGDPPQAGNPAPQDSFRDASYSFSLADEADRKRGQYRPSHCLSHAVLRSAFFLFSHTLFLLRHLLETERKRSGHILFRRIKPVFRGAYLLFFFKAVSSAVYARTLRDGGCRAAGQSERSVR